MVPEEYRSYLLLLARLQLGQQLRGRVVMTLVGGQIVHEA